MHFKFPWTRLVLVLVFSLFSFAANAEATTAIYRSVAPSATSAIATTTASNYTLTISGTTATFSGAQPANVGVGDAVQYDSDGNGSIDAVAFIHGRTSSTVYTMSTAAGGTPTAVSGDTDWSIFRAYTSLSNAETGTENTGLDDAIEDFDTWTAGRDLVTNDQQWNLTMYPNGTTADANVVISGWTTAATQYLRIYTATSTSEVGASQRHAGVWDTSKYYIDSTGAIGINLDIKYITIDGIQIRVNAASVSSIAGIKDQSTATAANGHVVVSNNIIRGGTFSGSSTNIGGINLGNRSPNTGVYDVYNNIIHDFVLNTATYIGITMASGLHNVYNNTLYNNRNGIFKNSTATYRVVNNLIQGSNTAIGGDFSANVNNVTDYNATNNASMGYTVVAGGGTHDRTSQTFTFSDTASKDFHLSTSDAGAKDYGTDLSANAYLAFSTDIDGDTRSSTWEIGADEVITADTTAPTVSTYSPTDDSASVSRTANLVLTFSESITAATGNITLVKTSGAVTVETISVADTSKVTVSGSTVTVNPAATLDPLTDYYVLIDSGSFVDGSSNAYTGIASNTTWNFTTVDADVTAPTVSTYSPEDNAIDISLTSNLVLTFSESITAATGNITLVKTSGAVTVETISVADTSKVTVSGSTVTVNPAATLDPLTDYYVLIDSGSFVDGSSNAYTGIASNTTWNFTTVDADVTAPTPGGSGTMTTSSVSGNSFTLSWTKAVDDVSGQGNLQYEVRRSSSSNIDSVANAEANGLIVKAYTADINSYAASGLSPNTTYYFNVIVKDEAGNKALYTTKSETTTTWSAPIGIPAPSFGISDEMTSAGCTNWPTAVSTGCYYVDRTDPLASDSTSGYPDRPRLTVPTSLAAGSYVEVHGTGYTAPTTWTLNGTEAQPVYIYGIGDTKPDFTGSQTNHELRGQWYIIDGIKWVNTRLRFGQGSVSDAHHAVLRHIEHTGWTGVLTTSMIGFNAAVSAHHDNVIYDSDIHDNGPLVTDTDVDQHGIGLGPNNNNFWLLDSRLYRNTGDGIQVNATNVTYMPSLHNIYVGRNTFYENKQAGFWSKQATDVIFSQNISHDHRPSIGSPGQCAGMQYGPERVWFLFNTLYNCDVGLRVASDDDGNGVDLYIIGNLIYDIGAAAPSYSTTDSSTAAAISLWDMENRYIVSNTIWNSVAGIKMSSGAASKVIITNNIIGQHTYSDDKEIWIPNISDAANSEMRNNVVIGQRIAWSQDTVENLAQFQSRTGKGQNSTTSTPTLVDAAGKNFRLADGDIVSREGGYASTVYDTFESLYGLSIKYDLDESARPQGALWDMGAYESLAVTPDTTAPTVSILSPSDNATSIAPTANLVMTFNETVAAGTGNIVIKLTSNNSTVETIDVTDTSKVTFSSNVVTINPATVLSNSTSYYVQVASGAIKDASNNSYTGIADTTTWNFTTENGDVTAPTVVTYSPADNAVDISPTSNLTLTYSENIIANSGNIIIKKISGDTTVETIASTDTSKVTVSNNTITINPATVLDDVTAYYITIDSGAFKDEASNNYAGISTSSTWNFTTSDTTAPVRSDGAPTTELAFDTTTTDVTLTTDETATCRYSINSGTVYGSMAAFTSTDSTSHTLSVTGLTNGSSYTYYVRCQDASANTNLTDYAITFSVGSDLTAPVVTSISASPDTTTATVTWTTDEAADSQVEYGTTVVYDFQTPVDSELVTSHSITLVTLDPETLYHYRIITADEHGNTTTSADDTFTTDAVAVTPPASSGGGSGRSGGGGGAVIDEQALINQLLAQIALLQAQIALLLGGNGSSILFTQDLTLGSTGTQVTALQQRLGAQGFFVLPAGATYGYFGLMTRDALKKFQAAKGILASGYFGPITRAYMNGTSSVNPVQQTSVVQAPVNQTQNISSLKFTRDLTLNDSGSDVMDLQNYLIGKNIGSAARALASSGASGFFGPLTMGALIEFQIANNIRPADGILGISTRILIGK